MRMRPVKSTMASEAQAAAEQHRWGVMIILLPIFWAALPMRRKITLPQKRNPSGGFADPLFHVSFNTILPLSFAIKVG